MSRSRVTVILYSAACAETASAANAPPPIATCAVVATIPKRRIAYSLRFPNPPLPVRKSHSRNALGALNCDITRPRRLRKGSQQRVVRAGWGIAAERQLTRSPRLDVRRLYHLGPGGKLRSDP